MNNNHNSRFSEGFFLGLILGAALVFLFGTKQGKNLVKILSDQGIDGLSDLLEEYDLGKMEEDDLTEQDIVDDEELSPDEVVESKSAAMSVDERPRKRFFKRFKKVN